MSSYNIVKQIPGLLEEVKEKKFSLPDTVKRYVDKYPDLTYKLLYAYCKAHNIEYKSARNCNPSIDTIPGLLDDLKSGIMTVAEVATKYATDNPFITYKIVYRYCGANNIEKHRYPSIGEIIELVDDLKKGDLCVQDVLEKYKPKYPDLTYGRIWEYVQASDIIPRKRRQCFNEDFFFTWTPELAYILGWLVSDGYIAKSNCIGITILKKDAEVLENIKNIIKWNKPVKYASKIRKRLGKFEEGKTYVQEIAEMRLYSKRVCEHIAPFGLIQNKTNTIGWIKEVPENLAHHFIRGVFDGDGSVFISKNKLYFNITGNYGLLEEIQKRINLVVPKGIRGSLHKGHGKQCWQLAYSGDINVKPIFNYMYKDSEPTIRMKRKYLRFTEKLKIHTKIIFEN